MNAVADITQQISTLVDTNRVLRGDLRDRQRAGAALGRRRKALRGEIAQLSRELRDESTSREARTPGTGLQEIRTLLVTVRRNAERLHRERDTARGDAATAHGQLAPIEQHMDALARAMEELDLERVQITREVDATTAAMAEIKSCLEASLEEA